VPCTATSPIPCPDRKAAHERKDFQQVEGIGWVWWRAINPLKPWAKCPWCGGALPMPGPVPKADATGCPEPSPYRDGEGWE